MKNRAGKYRKVKAETYEPSEKDGGQIFEGGYLGRGITPEDLDEAINLLANIQSFANLLSATHTCDDVNCKDVSQMQKVDVGLQGAVSGLMDFRGLMANRLFVDKFNRALRDMESHGHRVFLASTGYDREEVQLFLESGASDPRGLVH